MGFSLRARDAPRTRWPFNPTRATRARLARAWFGLAPFRSPLLRRDLTSSGYVRCFSSPAYLHTGYVFTGGSQGITLRGCPIRTSSAPSLLAAPRGISLLRHVLHRHERARHPPDALRHGLARRRPGLPASPTTRDHPLHNLLVRLPRLLMFAHSRPRLLSGVTTDSNRQPIHRKEGWWR